MPVGIAGQAKTPLRSPILIRRVGELIRWELSSLFLVVLNAVCLVAWKVALAMLSIAVFNQANGGKEVPMLVLLPLIFTERPAHDHLIFEHNR